MVVKTLREIVGEAMISEDESVLAEYSGDMSLVPRIRPKCVVKLQESGQLQELVKWANETGTPLVPVSSGAPHFRGDTVPSAGGAVIVDLSGLKKITRIDTPNRVAMIEAGVSFSELIPQLTKAGLRLNMPRLPRANKSVVASMLDREPVLMPRYQWDIQDPLTCAEVVFGTGDVFRTGSAAGPGTLEEQWNARQAQVNPMGPGQTSFGNVLQGSQGTLGIVTWATARCEQLPALQQSFLVGSEEYERLSDFIYRVLWWKASEELLVLNGSDLAAMLAVTPGEFDKIRESLPRWVLFLVLAGFDYYPEEKIAYQHKALKEETGKIGLSLVDSLSGLAADTLLKLLQQPSEEPYWKLRWKGACQDIFFLTTLDRVPQFVEIMLEQTERYGYPAEEVGIYIQPVVQGTSCHCEFNLFYSPGNRQEAARMQEFYLRVGEVLMRAGAFFSRPYGILADEVYRRDAATTESLRKVKNIFDPNDIMNAGKLCF